MNGYRISKIRKLRNITVEELAQVIGRSPLTISRYENDAVKNWDIDIINKIADALDTSSTYLMGITDNPQFFFDPDISSDLEKWNEIEVDYKNIIVTDNDMAPEIPKGARVQIRTIALNEKLQIGSYYYVEFNKYNGFRMFIDDLENGMGFLPINPEERRIGYDSEYVNVIGKAVSMKVLFEDSSEY